MANGQVSATICENKDVLFSKRLVEFWSRWAEYNPFGDKPMPKYPSPFE